MAITSNRYVDITSGVGGAAAVGTRELLLRLMTANELVPTGSVLQFSDADSVLEYFGSTSEEYKQAAFYFGFISKVITTPKNIQFGRWADADTNSQVFGAKVAKLDVIKLLSGNITFSIGGVESVITLPDLSSASTYADVALSIQNVMTGMAGTPVELATFVFDAQRSGFVFESNVDKDGEILITGSNTVLTPLGLDTAAIFSNGVEKQEPVEAVSQLAELNNNMGSFSFIEDIDLAQIIEVANWNLGRNIEFQYQVKCLTSEAVAYEDALIGFGGTGVTLYEPANSDYPWLLPCALLASQQFDKPAASANYMYQNDARLKPVVNNTSDSKKFDDLRMNYIGLTQENGTNLQFYQRGVLMGGAQYPSAMGVYANEQWLKAYLKAGFLNMFLAMQQVPADEEGELLGYSYIDEAIAQAKENGSIATGKQLTVTQKNFIKQLSGDENAHLDISSKGWWRTVKINQETSGGVTSYFMDYTLIYAKRDSVDKVQGRHVLI